MEESIKRVAAALGVIIDHVMTVETTQLCSITSSLRRNLGHPVLSSCVWPFRTSACLVAREKYWVIHGNAAIRRVLG